VWSCIQPHAGGRRVITVVPCAGEIDPLARADREGVAGVLRLLGTARHRHRVRMVMMAVGVQVAECRRDI